MNEVNMCGDNRNVNFIGIEIVEEYANIARDRLSAEQTEPLDKDIPF